MPGIVAAISASRQRSGRDDEAADRDDAAAEIAEVRRSYRRPSRSSTLSAVTCPAPSPAVCRPLILRVGRHGRLFEDRRRHGGRRLGEPDHIASHVHHRALLRQHGAMEGRADLDLEIAGVRAVPCPDRPRCEPPRNCGQCASKCCGLEASLSFPARRKSQSMPSSAMIASIVSIEVIERPVKRDGALLAEFGLGRDDSCGRDRC